MRISNRLLYIKNIDRFSFVVDLFSWALPFNFDVYPGGYGWTYRFRILCFDFHFRSKSWMGQAEAYEERYSGDFEDDLPF